MSQKRYFIWGFPVIILIILFVLLVYGSGYITTFFISSFYSKVLHPNHYNETTTAAIGNTLTGTLGLAIAFVASYLTFLAFWVQYIANEQLKKDLRIERFENKFYQMLQIHRNNVSEVNIKNTVSGRKSFSRLFNELRYIYYYCEENINQQTKNSEIKLSKDKIYNISYLIFFFGEGQVSTKLVDDILDDEDKPIFTQLVQNIQETKENYRTNIKKENSGNNKKAPLKVQTGANTTVKFDYKYIPFQGHMGNLSHYIRHLFQLVKFVDEQYPGKEKGKKKDDYITIIRSQLSIYEQALLYYNALSVLGQPWLNSETSNNGLLKKYTLIKSLPKPLADFHKTPDQVFGTQERNEEDNILFEWTEIKKRYQNIR